MSCSARRLTSFRRRSWSAAGSSGGSSGGSGWTFGGGVQWRRVRGWKRGDCCLQVPCFDSSTNFTFVLRSKRLFSLSMFRCWIREACGQAKLWPRCARKPGDGCEFWLFSSGRFIVSSSCNASYNAVTSGFISTAICNQNGDSELTSIGQGDKSYVVGGGGDPPMSPGTASLVCEKSPPGSPARSRLGPVTEAVSVFTRKPLDTGDSGGLWTRR